MTSHISSTKCNNCDTLYREGDSTCSYCYGARPTNKCKICEKPIEKLIASKQLCKTCYAYYKDFSDEDLQSTEKCKCICHATLERECNQPFDCELQNTEKNKDCKLVKIANGEIWCDTHDCVHLSDLQIADTTRKDELTKQEKAILIFSLERLIESDSLFSWNQDRTKKLKDKLTELWK